MKKVLVVGDIILDTYQEVTTERMAQEADIPVYDKTSIHYDRLGGAANVATNIKALLGDEAEVSIAGICGGRSIDKLRHNEINTCHTGFWRAELIKYRFVCDNKVIFRLDNKKLFNSDVVGTFELNLPKFKNYDLIVVSDYDKGTISDNVAAKIMMSGTPVIIDSKRKDLRIFMGAQYLNINEHEYSAQVSNDYGFNIEQIFKFVLVTLGERGSELRQAELALSNENSYTTHVEHFSTKKVEAVDVTGCGDTHTAAFAAGLLRDPNDVRGAVRYANHCATLAVQKFGTTRISKWDFSKSLEVD